MDKVVLSPVATSGNYNDLTNKPTIPASVTESTVSGWGFTKNTGTYSKPSGGIPKSDLASAVQTSLGKADTALSVNDARDLYVSKSSVVGVDNSSVIDVNIFIDPSDGIFYGLPSMSEYCDDVIATKNTLKTINGESIVGSGDITISGGGDYLPLSGGTITGDLTITRENGGAGNLYVTTECYAGYFTGGKYFFDNNNALLGSTKGFTLENPYGDYVIEFTYKGDGTKFLSDDGTYKTISSGSSGGSIDTSNFVTSIKIDNVSKTPSNGVVDLGYINKKLTTSTSSSMTLSPNVYYRNTSTSLSSLTITLGSVSNSNIINEYFVEFTTRSSGTSVSLPSGIKWMNGVTPTFDAGTTYQISIVNNLGTWVKFS